jgi:hypothetical protein
LHHHRPSDVPQLGNGFIFGTVKAIVLIESALVGFGPYLVFALLRFIGSQHQKETLPVYTGTPPFEIKAIQERLHIVE